MKDGLKYIIGKRIAGVVVAASNRDPRNQVFLVFDDGTRFEFWGPNFSCCSGLDKAADLVAYLESGNGEIRALYGDIRQISATEPGRAAVAASNARTGECLQKRVQRVFGALRQARELIERAKQR